MSKPCEIYRNPIRRDGTSQKQRLMPTFEPDYVQIDERNLFDLLQYAWNYAKYINYYTLNQEIAAGTTQDWQPFFDNDFVRLSFVLGRNNIQSEYANLYSNFRYTFTNQTNAINNLKILLAFGINLLNELDALIENNLLAEYQKDQLKALKGSLAPLLQSVIALEKGAVQSFPGDYSIDMLPYNGLDNSWIPAPYTSWTAYFNAVAADDEPFNNNGNIGFTLLTVHYVDELINQSLIKLLLPVLQEIEANFKLDEVAPDQDVEPYFALFLSFLQLFSKAQEQLNSLAQTQLNFYYEEVLRIKRSEAIPDKVHVLFTLAKGINEKLVAHGSRLKAGKDANGQDVIFETDDELVVNKIKIEEIKSARAAKNDSNQDSLFVSPITNSEDGFGLNKDEGTFGLFGNSNLEGRLGFAIASPQLLMKQGERKIKLTMNCVSVPSSTQFSLGLLDVYVSGAEGWIQLTIGDSGVNYALNRLSLNLNVSRDLPAITGYDQAVLGDEFNTTYPVLKVVLKQGLNALSTKLSLLKVINYQLNVEVTDLSDVIIQNDEGVLDPSKPFFPFTNDPKINSAFYVGSAEVFSKAITNLRINLLWMGLPNQRTGKDGEIDEFKTHYAYYDQSSYVKNNYFTAKFSFLRNYSWQQLTKYIPMIIMFGLLVLDYFVSKLQASLTLAIVQPITNTTSKYDDWVDQNNVDTSGVELFAELNYGYCGFDENGNPQCYTGRLLPTRSFNFDYTPNDATDLELIQPTRNVDLIQDEAYSANSKNGFIRVELKRSFFQDIYPKVLTKAVRANTSIPNKPYIPIIKSVSVDYTSDLTLNFSSADAQTGKIEKFYHIGNFGVKEVFPEGTNNNKYVYLMPDRLVQTNDGVKQFLAETYFGLSGVETPQSVSIYFQFAEGTEDPDLTPPKMVWSYLQNNTWQPFPNEAVIDDTNGLLRSGIVKLALPVEMTKASTLFNGNLNWIKVSAVSPSANTVAYIESISQVIQIATQAVKATFTDQGNDPQRLQSALPANTVNQLESRLSEVREIKQPYPSFDGKLAELGSNFQVRVSERLRHKNRALTIHDYERLVLEKFPDILKVKCINHYSEFSSTRGGNPTSTYAEYAPGNLCVILIPDSKKFASKNNPYQLKASANKLSEVQQYLSSIAPPFVNILVKNPNYQTISIVSNVVFKAGFDAGHYSREVSLEIKKFLSPWSFGESEKISFGGKIDGSAIVNHIEELPYVDYISDFDFYFNGTFIDAAEATTNNLSGVLTTTNTHTINTIIS